MPSRWLSSSTSSRNRWTRVVPLLASASNVSGQRNRQNKLHQKRNHNRRASVLDAAAPDLSHASAVRSIAALLDYGVCRNQPFRDLSLEQEFAAQAQAVSQVLTDNKILAQRIAQQLAADPMLKSAADCLLAEEQLGRRNAASSVDLEISLTASEQGSAAKAMLERLLVDQAEAPEDCEAEQAVPTAARCLQRARRKLQKAETMAERRKWRRACQQLALGDTLPETGPGAAVEFATRRRFNADRRASASFASTSGRAAADLGSNLRHGHPMLRQPRMAATVKAGQEAKSDLGDALSILLGDALPLLSREEERILMVDFRAGLDIREAITWMQGPDGQMPSAEELTSTLQMSLPEIRAALELGWKAKHALLHANKRLVFKLAHLHGDLKAVPLEDYIMAGMQGLYKGLEKWDPSRGHRLVSLLYWWIRSEITTVTDELRGIVPLPKTARLQLRKVQLTRQYLADQRGRQPSMQELAWEMQMSPVAMSALLHMEQFTEVAAEDPLPANGLVSGRRARCQGGKARESDLVFGYLQACKEEDTPEHFLKQVTVMEAMEQLLRNLPQRQAEVLRRVYGLHSGEPQSQKLIAKEFKVTFTTINNIRKAALAALRAQGMAQDIRSAST